MEIILNEYLKDYLNYLIVIGFSYNHFFHSYVVLSASRRNSAV